MYPLIDNCPDEGLGYVIGGPGVLDDSKQRRLSAKIAATHRVKAIGTHELKAGVDVEDNQIDFVRGLSGGAAYNVIVGSGPRPGVTDVFRLINLTGEGLTETCRDRATNREFPCSIVDRDRISGTTITGSAFVRDVWQVLPSLTIQYGLRYEQHKVRYAPHLWNTVDPISGNSRGKNALNFRNMWAPRIGAAYDWTSQGRSKVYGHWGRYYESIPLKINARPLGGEASYRQLFLSSQCGPSDPQIGGPSGPECLSQGQVPALNEGIFGRSVLVAPGTKPQFLDEFILGVEYEPFTDFAVGVAFQHRSIGRVLEDVSVDGGSTFILSNPGEWSLGEERRLNERIARTDDPIERVRLEQQLEQFKKIRNFDAGTRKYHALQLTLRKRFSSGLYIQGAYTHSRIKGNYPGLFSSNNRQIDPNINTQFDFVELLGNRNGPLDIDSPHAFKLDSYYTFHPSKYSVLTGGIRLRAASGRPINVLAGHYQYGDGESFLLPRGAVGRTQWDFNTDLHLAYRRKLSKDVTLEAFVDLLSVFNRQVTEIVDQEYTDDFVNPIIGGELEDLVFAKQQGSDGKETSEPVTRNRNFLNTIERAAPFSVRLGARLKF